MHCNAKLFSLRAHFPITSDHLFEDQILIINHSNTTSINIFYILHLQMRSSTLSRDTSFTARSESKHHGSTSRQSPTTPFCISTRLDSVFYYSTYSSTTSKRKSHAIDRVQAPVRRVCETARKSTLGSQRAGERGRLDRRWEFSTRELNLSLRLPRYNT